MRPIGFSTGALAKGDVRRAVHLLREHNVEAVELSALRLAELAPLIDSLGSLDLHGFRYVSFHAPSRFGPEQESCVLRALETLLPLGWPIVPHPDEIYDHAAWRALGSSLLIENMDKRKPIGRNVRELCTVLDALPNAGFCLDIGHARQIDPTMTEAALLLDAFGERLTQVHVSEVNMRSGHDPLSAGSIAAFRSIAHRVSAHVPLIIESPIDQAQSTITAEIGRARQALTSHTLVAARS